MGQELLGSFLLAVGMAASDGWVARCLQPAAPIPLSETGPSLTSTDSALHVLNRLAYGPRPGQVDQVAREGVFNWIRGQLASARPTDPALSVAEPSYAVLHLDPRELARRFEDARREQKQRKEVEGRGEEARVGMLDETRRLSAELQQVAVIRAIRADFQLREVMVDFWINHFNVNLRKGADRVFLPSFVEQTIRRNALGRFEDLLIATAESPAMLFYLDNVQSVAPGSEPPPGRFDWRRRSVAASGKRPTGINENYARELMELHTLGVDAGYTQRDVVDVARIFTGWGIRRPEHGGGFEFREWAHDYGEKVVLGTRFPEGHGMDEGIRLLKMLADHPATMRHVSRKLCTRLVSDEPPDGCVDSAVRAWQESHGDVRKILLAIVQSPDFWARQAVQNKIKTPLEFVISALRAIDARPDSTPRLAGAIARLGQPLYEEPSPAGYPETQEEWVNSGALLARMNLAVALAASRLPGSEVDLNRLIPATLDHEHLLDGLDRQILGGRMSAHTRGVIAGEMNDIVDPARARELAVGLILGSPEFQRQ